MGGDSERLISCSKKAEGQIKKVTKEKLNQINKWKKKKRHTQKTELANKESILTDGFLEFLTSSDLADELPLKGVHTRIQLKGTREEARGKGLIVVI